MPRDPSPRIERRLEAGRLAWYRSDYDDDFWLRSWAPVISAPWYRQFDQGYLAEYETPFLNHLPANGPIVEAGCGAGHFVLALRSRGFDVEGIDLSAACVRAVKKERPDIPIRVGDARALDVPDGHFAGYLSLGVVEHVRGGPEPFLREAFRVLRTGGVGVFTVPWIHHLRRLKTGLGYYRGDRPDLPFYQFAFSTEEFTDLLRSAGFRVREVSGIAAFKGLKDEFPPLAWLARRPGLEPSMERWGWRILHALPAIERRLWHMLLVVVDKP